jgi:hypothetical protein
MTDKTTPAGIDLDRDTVRAVFMKHGFTIKEGQTDLKPYVYAAAAELIAIARQPRVSEQADGRALPALPEPIHTYEAHMGLRVPAFSTEQMHAYARAALNLHAAPEAPATQQAGSAVEGTWEPMGKFAERLVPAATTASALPLITDADLPATLEPGFYLVGVTASASGEPFMWFDPEQVERAKLTDYADHIGIFGSSVKFGSFTAPLYRTPVPSREAAPLDNGEVARLRRVVRALNMESQVPDDDATLRGCLFSVLGMIAYKLECAARAEQGAGQVAQEISNGLVQFFDEWEQIIPQDARAALQTIVSKCRESLTPTPTKQGE